MNVARPASPTLEEIAAAVASVCERHPVMRMQIFGSRASGRVHQGSDVDLLVEFLPEARIGLLEMGELKEDLEDVLGCTVDLISKAAVERSRNPFRRNSILSAPLTVYARLRKSECGGSGSDPDHLIGEHLKVCGVVRNQDRRKV